MRGLLTCGFVFLAGAISLLFIDAPSSSRDALRFIPSQLALPNASQSGESFVECELYNASSKPVIFRSINSSCGCTTLEFD